MRDTEPNGTVDLDRIDRTILKELSKDARLSMTELAKRVGLSKTPVSSRVKRLEEIGVITGYHVGLSWQKLGLGHICFVEIRLADTRQKALQAFNDAVRDIPEIEECHMIAGGYDYLLKVRTKDIQSFRSVLGECISALPHVSSSSSYVAMEAVKSRF
ncbi:Lrp/AsnC family transcriptional regulator [Notoacmeibacter sp. MSK16QG-6]|uniref:Lrp/AsnC family transcriptional regulator n=1 Tax=Notoacmeibacter sp. MSK16QG-6 TaxID=2957982 RepID=UPI0020A0B7FA|nr:Lrp/AsnC ligand binding domain-containing protein [Notoacmeibacter sp. MSK16QG-6]MCP1200741.1 Lrp/AsnC ligand binding domain-containing protein [Notoacmeibacter sp. MSK16QG-6]